MAYSVTAVATELMLEPAELKKVLDVFWGSAADKLEEAGQTILSGELTNLSQKMHALKGVAFSLHMTRLGEIAAKAERLDLLSQVAWLEIVKQLEAELRELREAVDAYYQAGT